MSMDADLSDSFMWPMTNRCRKKLAGASNSSVMSNISPGSGSELGENIATDKGVLRKCTASGVKCRWRGTEDAEA